MRHVYMYAYTYMENPLPFFQGTWSVAIHSLNENERHTILRSALGKILSGLWTVIGGDWSEFKTPLERHSDSFSM